MTAAAKKKALFAVTALFAIAALALIATRFFPFASSPPPEELQLRSERIAKLRDHAAAIGMLKAKCGLETKIEDETACQCDAETRINRQVDEVEEMLIADPTLEDAELELEDGRKIKAKALSDERLPETPECP